MTIVAFGLLFLLILQGAWKPAPRIESFQTNTPFLLGFQAKTIPQLHLTNTTDRIYAEDGTLLWIRTNTGSRYILPDDPTYKEGSAYYTSEQTVIVLFRVLDTMEVNDMKQLETTGVFDVARYEGLIGPALINDLMTTNKVSGVRVIQEVGGKALYTDGNEVALKTGPHDIPPIPGQPAAVVSPPIVSAPATQSVAEPEAKGLSAGAIAGIVIAVLVVLAIILYVVFRKPAAPVNSRVAVYV